MFLSKSKNRAIRPGFIVELYDIKPMTKADEEKACYKLFPKAQAWFLRNLRPIKPFPIKGQLNIFEVNLPSKTF